MRMRERAYSLFKSIIFILGTLTCLLHSWQVRALNTYQINELMKNHCQFESLVEVHQVSASCQLEMPANSFKELAICWPKHHQVFPGQIAGLKVISGNLNYGQVVIEHEIPIPFPFENRKSELKVEVDQQHPKGSACQKVIWALAHQRDNGPLIDEGHWEVCAEAESKVLFNYQIRFDPGLPKFLDQMVQANLEKSVRKFVEQNIQTADNHFLCQDGV